MYASAFLVQDDRSRMLTIKNCRVYYAYCGLSSSISKTHPSKVLEQARIVTENYAVLFL